MASLQPYLLERRILPKVWGGRGLEKLGLTLPDSVAVGETWEVYDRADGSSVLKGSRKTLSDLMREDREDLLGRAKVHGTKFPLLVKLLDAKSRLSVQVHPDDAASQLAKGGDGGKHEAWVVMHAGPDAEIICGCKPGVTDAQFREVAHTDKVADLLHSFQPKVGDVIDVPPGTVHAIGPDVVVFEVQQNSDITYRLWDWGRPRETHVEQALSVVSVQPAGDGSSDRPVVQPEKIDAHGAWLVRNEFFRIRRFRIDSPASLGTEGAFKILTVVSGHATLGWQSGGQDAPLALRPGDCVLVPACVGTVFTSPVGPFEILWTDGGV